MLAHQSQETKWCEYQFNIPDSKVRGVDMVHIWGRQDPGWPHIGPMNFAIWDDMGNAWENFQMVNIWKIFIHSLFILLTIWQKGT